MKEYQIVETKTEVQWIGQWLYEKDPILAITIAVSIALIITFRFVLFLKKKKK